MMAGLRIIAVAAVACASLASAAHADWLTPRQGARLLASMKRAGFPNGTKPYNPSKHEADGARVNYVGRLHAGGASFKIYYYEYNDPKTLHGAHMLLVMTPADKYLGGYYVNEDAVPVAIKGADVLFNSAAKDGKRIHFGAGGPPEHAWIDGENPDFSRPEVR